MRAIVFFVEILAVAGLLLTPCFAQNFLNNPESIEYDFHSDAYFVSNWGDGNIVRIDSSGRQSVFYAGFTRLAGLYRYGNILFIASNLDPYIGVYGLDMGTAQMVVEIPIPGTGLMNDITSDTSGNLYVTDFYDSKIYKIRMSDYSVSLFVDSGLGNPNGIVFDASNNRLLTACQGNLSYPIKAISLVDTSISVLVYTYYAGVDGLAFDNEGRLYFSTWQTNAVYRYDTTYQNDPEIVASGFNGPADIFISRLTNLLCIPDFYNDTIVFVQLYPNAIDDISIPNGFSLTQNYPNPFNQNTVIEFALSNDTRAAIEIFNVTGQKVRTLVDYEKPAGTYKVIWDGADEFGQPVATGVYLYRLQAGNEAVTKKMVILK